MAFPVTLNSVTYTLADFEGLNYVEGFPNALEDFVTEAGTKVTAAATSATAAATSATASATSATASATSATAAAASATSAAASLDAIEGFYLGAAASDPTLDLNGDALTAGDWYFNTGSDALKVYNGSAFITFSALTFDVVDDTTPQLGGNLDFNGNTATSFASTGIDDNATSTAITIDSSENVGIGTASPNTYSNYTTLTLNGATSSALDFEGGGTLMGEVLATANDLILQTVQSDGELIFKSGGGSEAMRIDSIGQIIAQGSAASFDTAPAQTGLQLYYETDTGLATLGSYSAGGSTSLSFHTNSGGAASAEAMRIDSDGVVQFDNGISEQYNVVTSSSNATTVDLHAGTNFSHTLSENTTFTFSNPAASGRVSSFTLKVVQDASASGYTLTWPASVDWAAATAPTLTATANAVDYFVFITHDGGTNYYGFTAGQALG